MIQNFKLLTLEKEFYVVRTQDLATSPLWCEVGLFIKHQSIKYVFDGIDVQGMKGRWIDARPWFRYSF